MPTETPQPPVSAADKLTAGLSGAGSVIRDRSQRSAAPRVEPTMRALRRILGDEVLDVFPEGFTELVDALYDICKDDKDKWIDAAYGTASERNDALALMRAYAECADVSGYTIRTDRDAEPNELRFRVVTRKGSKGETAA